MREQISNRISARLRCKSILVAGLLCFGLLHGPATQTFARNPDEQQSPRSATSEFVVGYSLPAEFREKTELAIKAEQESRWTDAVDLRRQIKAECEKKYGTDDWRVVEAAWRLSLVEWIMKAPDKHRATLAQFRDTIDRRNALIAVGDVPGALVPMKELESDMFKVDALRPWQVLNVLVSAEALASAYRYRHATQLLIIARKRFDECSSIPHPIVYRIDLQFGYCLARSLPLERGRVEVNTEHARDVYASLVKACGDNYALRNGALLLAQTLELNGETTDADELYSKALAKWDGRTTLDKVERGTIYTTRAACCLAKGDLENAQRHVTDAKAELTRDDRVLAYPKAADSIITLFRVMRGLAARSVDADEIARNENLLAGSLDNVAKHIAYHVKSNRDAGQFDKAYELQWALVNVTKVRYGPESSEHLKALETAAELAESREDTAKLAVLKQRLRK